MSTTFVKGDLFETPEIRAYAHTVNCAGTMDAGVAIAFKKRWPRMFEDYQLRCKDRRLALGDVFVWNEDDVVVYNLATQQSWRARSKLPALSRAVKKMLDLAAAAGVKKIGLPRIGTGLGGFDWKRVRSILEEHGAGSPVELVVFEQFIRAGRGRPEQEDEPADT
jgi:O-acetyl-ADP-ribose deacetylase (regulator of RNase III)